MGPLNWLVNQRRILVFFLASAVIGYVFGTRRDPVIDRHLYENGWTAGYAHQYKVPWNARRDYLSGVKMGWWLHQYRDSVGSKALKKYGIEYRDPPDEVSDPGRIDFRKPIGSK